MTDEELIRQIGIYQAGVPGYRQNIMPRPRDAGGQMVERKMYEPLPNAFVSSKNPRVAHFDEDVTRLFPYVASHEFEHQLEQLADERYYRNQKPQTEKEKIKNSVDLYFGAQTNFLFDNLEKLGVKNRRAAVDQIKFGLAGQEVKNYLAEKFNLDKKLPFGRIGQPDQPLFEYLADLSGLETHYGTDLTQDPVIKKRVFNNDDRLIQAYKSVTGLRQQRLDAKDLPPYTPQTQEKSFVNYFKDLLFNKNNF